MHRYRQFQLVFALKILVIILWVLGFFFVAPFFIKARELGTFRVFYTAITLLWPSVVWPFLKVSKSKD